MAQKSEFFLARYPCQPRSPTRKNPIADAQEPDRRRARTRSPTRKKLKLLTFRRLARVRARGYGGRMAGATGIAASPRGGGGARFNSSARGGSTHLGKLRSGPGPGAITGAFQQAGGAQSGSRAGTGRLCIHLRPSRRRQSCFGVMSVMKMRTRNPAASADIGSVIQSETARHRYIAAQVAKNPRNDVASCPRLHANIGA